MEKFKEYVVIGNFNGDSRNIGRSAHVGSTPNCPFSTKEELQAKYPGYEVRYVSSKSFKKWSEDTDRCESQLH